MSASDKKVSFTVRQMTSKDIDFVLTLTKQLDWKKGKNEPHITMAIDPESEWVAEDNQTGEPIGMLLGVNHTPTFAFIGDYAVLEKYRGQGIGQAMWAKMAEHVKISERNVALTAELEMFPIYKDKLGFSHVSHSISKYGGIPDLTNPNLIKSIDGIKITRVDETNIDKVRDYDLKVCHGLRHVNFLRECIAIPPSEGLFMCALNGDNQVMGYCLLVLSNFDTVLVQPLYADNKEIAELLVYNSLNAESPLKEVAKGNGIWMQIIDGQEEGLALAKKLGKIDWLLSVPLLFTKKNIEGEKEKIFFTCSPDLHPF